MQPSSSVEKFSENELLARLTFALVNESLENALKSTVRLLRTTSDHFDWVGIYLVRDETLVLAAYAGAEETEHVRIPIGQGICGTAVKEGETIVVPDVGKDPRYLACFASTRSEIVVPIKGSKHVLGEIDIDSDRFSAFTQRDQKTLESVASILAAHLEKHDFHC